jgi:hypothetical protein
MLRANLWNESVSRVELDQRARDARLRLERIERLLVLRAALTDSWLRRVLWLFSFGRSGEGSRARRTGRTLSNHRPRLPQIQDVWVEECGAFCRASALSLCHPSG